MQWQTSREPVPPVDPASGFTTGDAPHPVDDQGTAAPTVTRRSAALAAGGALALGLVGGGLAVAYTPLGDVFGGQTTTQNGIDGSTGFEGMPGQPPDDDSAVGGTQPGGPQQGGPQLGGPGGDQGTGSDSDEDSAST